MTTLSPRVRSLHACVLGVALALALDANSARAQSQAPPPPRPPQEASSPVVAPPMQLPPPPAPVAAARASAAAQPAVAPIRPAPQAASAVPPDSVRPAAAKAAVTPPANAVAQCRDGTFILPPNDAASCATHRGVVVHLPRVAGAPPPVAPASRTLAPLVAARAAVPAAAAPPADATMRCKDGTYLFGAPADGRCANYGGLAAVLPTARETPPPPAPRRP